MTGDPRASYVDILLQAGYTCSLVEGCGRHFTCLPEFTEHTLRHKEDMKKRLICTHELTKTSLCGLKFNNRKEFNAHVEEHNAVFRAKTLSG